MNVIVIGCGRIGAQLAYNMYKRGHKVSVIDENEKSFGNLPADFEGRLHEGDALNQDILLRAGIDRCDALAAVTNYDPLNAVISHVARQKYAVPNVVARNYNPHLRGLFEDFNIQVVSSTSWGAQRIEEMLTDTTVRTVFSAGNGEVEVYELNIPPAWGNRKVNDLVTCGACKWLAVTRAGNAFLPDGDTVLEEGDILTVAATMDGIFDTRRNLNAGKGG